MNNYAITSEELATSLEKSSAALVAAGNSVEQAQALEIAGNTILQDSDTVANAIKVLSMRLRGTSAKALEDAGEDTEGLIEDASKLYNTVKNLTKTQSNPEGVEIIDKETNAYKSTYEILLEISKVWEDINDASKSALLETIAGKTRGAAAAAILQNPNILESAYTDALYNSDGAGAKALETSLDSIEKKIEIFQNKIKHFAQTLIDSGLIKWFVDAGSSILDFSEKIGSLNSLVGLGTFVFSLSKGFNLRNTPEYLNNIKDLFKPNQKQLDYLKVGQFAKEQNNFSSIDMSAINKFIELINSGKTEVEAIALSMSKTNNETRDLASGFTDIAGNVLPEFAKGSKLAEIATGVLSSGLITLATMALEWAISALIKYSQRLRQSVEDLSIASEEQEKYNNSIVDSAKKYDELYNKLQDTKKGTNDFIEVENDLLAVQNNLKDSLGDEANELDLVNGKYNEQIALLKKTQREKAKEYTTQHEEDYQNNIKFLNKGTSLNKYNLKGLPSQELKNLLKEYGIDTTTVTNNQGKVIGNNYISETKSTEERYYDLKEIIDELEKNRNKYNQNEISYNETLNWLKEEYKNLDLTEIENALSNIETYTKMTALGDASYSDKYQELQDKATEYNNALASHDQERIANAKSDFETIIAEIDIDNIENETIKEAFQKIVDSISEDLIKSNNWYNRLQNSGKFTKGQFTEAEVRPGIKAGNFTADNVYGDLVKIAKVNVKDTNEFEQFIAILKDLGYVVDNFAGKDKQETISSILADTTEKTDKLTSSLSSAYSAYEKLLNPSAKPEEILSSIKELNTVAKEVKIEIPWEELFSDGELSLEELNQQLDIIGEAIKNKLLDDFSFEGMPEGWEQFINGLVDAQIETQKATVEFDKMTTSLDKLQSSYTTLKDVMTAMNSGQGLSLDQLQSLMSAEENYISMLTVENGQLTINTDKYQELVAQELASFKAKLDEAAATEIAALGNDELASSAASATSEIQKNTGALGENTVAAYKNALAKGVSKEAINGVIKKYNAIWNAAVKQYSGNFDAFMGGSDAGADRSQEYKELLDKEINILKAQLDGGYNNFNDYISKRRNLVEQYYAQNKITAEQYYSELNDLYEDQLSLYDRVIKAVEKQLDNQIKGYNKQKDAIDEEIKKLQDANEERKKAIELQEKQYALARAENQRTRLVYRNGQLQYLNDPEEIRNARQELEDARLERQVEILEKQKDEIDELIKKVEEYKDKWSEISSIWEEMQDKALADVILGDNWEDLVNALDPGIFENFKNGYLDLQRTIADNKIQLAEAEYQAALNDFNKGNGGGSSGINIEEKPSTTKTKAVYDKYSGNLLGLFDTEEEAKKRLWEHIKLSGNDNGDIFGITDLEFDIDGYAKEVEVVTGQLKNWGLYIGDADTEAKLLDSNFIKASNDAKKVLTNLRLDELQGRVNDIIGEGFVFDIDVNDEASPKLEDLSLEEIPDKYFNIDTDDSDAMNKLTEIEGIYLNNKDVLIETLGEDNFYKIIQSIEEYNLEAKVQEVLADDSDVETKFDELNNYILDRKQLWIDTLGEDEANKIFDSLENGNLEKALEIIANSDNAERDIEKVKDLLNGIDSEKNININTNTTETKTIIEKHIIEEEYRPYSNPNSKFTRASGTVSNGTAFAKGKDITNGYDGTALVGELGAEMRIRDGKFELIGKNGAEFTDVKKNDIIFNH